MMPTVGTHIAANRTTAISGNRICGSAIRPTRWCKASIKGRAFTSCHPLPSIERQSDFDRGVHGGLLDITHGVRVGGDAPFYRRRIGQLLRRLASAGEQDARPDGLHLRGVAARCLLV